MTVTRFRSRAAMWGLALLAACGGGGGGGGETSAPAPAPPPASQPPAGGASGLLPQAPALGAVVAADPSRLRPAIDGATWHFEGRYLANPFATPVSYGNRISQQLRADGKVVETNSNGLNAGPDSEELSLVDGQLVASAEFNFSGRAAETIRSPVLRAPVRAGDQYTLLDKRYTDTDFDGDQDGKVDALDVAFYYRVVGIETVDLPVVGAVRAVRIDGVLLQRVQYSRDASYSRTFEVASRTWYLEGVGPVRSRLESTRISGDGVETHDELLTYWDGVDAGLGMSPLMPEVPGTVNGRFATHGGPQAFAFAGHALLVGRTEASAGSTISTLAVRYDKRGQILGSAVADWSDFGSLVGTAQHRDGVAVVATSSDLSLGVLLGSTDAFGNRNGGPQMARVPLGGTRLTIAMGSVRVVGDDTRVWLVWQRTYRDTDPQFSVRREFVVRPYSPQGVPLAEERTFPVVGDPPLPAATARGGRLLLVWGDASTAPRLQTAVVEIGVAATEPRTLYTAPLREFPFQLRPLLFDSGGALLWSLNGTPVSNVETYGLRLDSAWAPVQIGATPDADRIGGVLSPPLADAEAPQLASSVGSRLVMLASSRSSAQQQPTRQIVWIDSAADTALAAAAQQSLTLRPLNGSPQAIAPYADRVVLFFGTTSAVLWLRTPAP